MIALIDWKTIQINTLLLLLFVSIKSLAIKLIWLCKLPRGLPFTSRQKVTRQTCPSRATTQLSRVWLKKSPKRRLNILRKPVSSKGTTIQQTRTVLRQFSWKSKTLRLSDKNPPYCYAQLIAAGPFSTDLSKYANQSPAWRKTGSDQNYLSIPLALGTATATRQSLLSIQRTPPRKEGIHLLERHETRSSKSHLDQAVI